MHLELRASVTTSTVSLNKISSETINYWFIYDVSNRFFSPQKPVNTASERRSLKENGPRGHKWDWDEGREGERRRRRRRREAEREKIDWSSEERRRREMESLAAAKPWLTETRNTVDKAIHGTEAAKEAEADSEKDYSTDRLRLLLWLIYNH